MKLAIFLIPVLMILLAGDFTYATRRGRHSSSSSRSSPYSSHSSSYSSSSYGRSSGYRRGFYPSSHLSLRNLPESDKPSAAQNLNYRYYPMPPKEYAIQVNPNVAFPTRSPKEYDSPVTLPSRSAPVYQRSRSLQPPFIRVG
ncbi:hypothetical protein ILUMI_14213 [Ignelater luminosus]|uniref:Uncharacterized protein n=1 Tax=Ignelater luminosus TaxID=2038154 RepID=A0A8K0G524_IGNLU|nr:hypothetical protein ILUMI_14213 [Ignelater luminosus]